MEAFRAACCLVQPCLLGPGQETVTVLDRSGHNSKAMGLEFRQADDNISVKHDPGEAHVRYEIRIKADLLRIVPDVLIIALRCLHKACPFEGLLIRAIAENARIVSYNNGSRPHRFHLVHNGTEDRRVGDDAFLRFRGAKHVRLYEYLLPSELWSKKLEDLYDRLMNVLVCCGMDHYLCHGLTPLLIIL